MLLAALSTTACGVTTSESLHASASDAGEPSHSDDSDAGEALRTDASDAGDGDAPVFEAAVIPATPPDAPPAGSCLLLVTDDHASPAEEALTPAGTFVVDASGALRNDAGLSLVGFRPSSDGARSTTRAPLVAARQRPARATSRVRFIANLSSTSTTPPAAFSLTEPWNTSNFSMRATVYDAHGATHAVDLFFRMAGPYRWDWHALTAMSAMSVGASPTYLEGAAGTLVFNYSGALASEQVLRSSWSFVEGMPAQSIEFDFGTNIDTEGGFGRDGVTQFGSASNLTALSQDGVTAGAFERLTLTIDGEVDAWYSNDEQVTLGWITLARLWTPRGLSPRGSHVWAPSPDPESWTPGIASTHEATGGVSCMFARASVADGVRLDLVAAFFGG